MSYLKSASKILILLVILLSFGVSTRPAYAISGSGDITVGCDGIIDNGSSFTADRDNTGAKEEAYTLSATDGAGVVLLSYTDSVPLGFTASLGSGPWDTAPTANPITFRWISHAGNGLAEQVILNIVGECPGLPYISTVSGPLIPDGFVLRTITCDVSVFSIAGDLNTSIAGARLLNGQTWYVDSKTVKGADGKAWRQVFTSNTDMGYIPNSCVK